MSAPLLCGHPFCCCLSRVDCCARQKHPTVFSFQSRSASGGLEPAQAYCNQFPRYTQTTTPVDTSHAAARRPLLPRYQHLDVYLPPSLNPGTSPAPNSASAAANVQPAKSSASGPGGASPVPGPLAAAAAAARTDERASALGQHRLPAIDFTGAAKRDAVARARENGRRGVVKPSSSRQPSSETGGVTPTAAEGGTADQAGGGGGGNASGELEEADAVDSGEETTSVDGEEEEEDFLALPTERAENNGGDGGEVRKVVSRSVKRGVDADRSNSCAGPWPVDVTLGCVSRWEKVAHCAVITRAFVLCCW